MLHIILITLLDSWPSNNLFWPLCQLDAVNQKCIGGVSSLNVVGQKVDVFWIHLYKQSLQHLPGNSYISPTCVIYIFESVAHSLSLVWIPYGIIFVACYLSCSEWFLLRISGPHGPRRGPRGPKAPLAQSPPQALGPFIGALGPGPVPVC